jgi:hypothetical protein
MLYVRAGELPGLKLTTIALGYIDELRNRLPRQSRLAREGQLEARNDDSML